VDQKGGKEKKSIKVFFVVGKEGKESSKSRSREGGKKGKKSRNLSQQQKREKDLSSFGKPIRRWSREGKKSFCQKKKKTTGFEGKKAHLGPPRTCFLLEKREKGGGGKASKLF